MIRAIETKSTATCETAEFLDLEIKQVDVDTGKFTGMGSVFDVPDLVNDIVSRGAFKRTIKRNNGQVPLLWQHRFDQVIGIAFLEETEKGLKVKGELNLEVEKAREALSLLRQKAVRGLSIGFDVVKQEFEGDMRILKELKLGEISIVTFPAQPRAKITNVKRVAPFRDLSLAPEETRWDLKAAEKRVRKWAGAADGLEDKDVQDKYAKAFACVNDSEPEEFASYHLLIADVLEGKLKAVPRAVFTAAAMVQGVRGGVDLGSDGLPQVRNHLARYYSKMDLTPPWEAQSVFHASLAQVLGFAEAYKGAENLSEINAVLLDSAVISLSDLRKRLDQSGDTQVQPSSFGSKNANEPEEGNGVSEVVDLLATMSKYATAQGSS